MSDNTFQPAIGSTPIAPVQLPPKPSGGMPEDFTGWMMQLWEHVRSLAPQGDNQYIAIDWRHDGITVKLNPDALPVPPPVTAAEGTQDTYSGPFMLVNQSTEDETIIRIIDGSHQNGATSGYVSVGISNSWAPEYEFPGGPVWLRVYWNDDTAAYAVEFTTEPPPETLENELYYYIGSYSEEAGLFQSWKSGNITDINGRYWV